MNKYCVIGRNFKTYFIKRLSEEVGQGLSFYNPWENENPPLAGTYLFRSSAIYGSNIDLESLVKLPSWAKVINSAQALNNFRDKKRQYSLSLGRPFQSIPWLSLAAQAPDIVQEFFLDHPDVIIKPLRGQGGWGVERLSSATFVSWWNSRVDEDYLLQKFIPGNEWRIFFIQDQLWCLKRSGEGSAVNFAQGGEAELISPPKDLQKLVQVCIQNSGAFYGAIDLIENEGEYYFLELNLSPGIEQLEKVSGDNIISELLQALNSIT